MKKILILIIVSLIFYGLWRWNSPYPSVLNWDIWEHQTVVSAIRAGHFALVPSQLSDTFRFDGYTTAFHMLIAGAQTILHTQNIPGFWWIAEGVFFVLTSIGTYMFVKEITKNTSTAIMAGVLSAGLFESAVAFTTLFLLPQTIAALLWVVGMAFVAKQKTTKQRLLVATLATLIILPFHAIVGALGGLFLFVLAVQPNINLLLVLIASYAIPTFLATQFHLAALNGGEALYFNQSLLEKLTLMRQWYGLLPIPLLALGMWKGNKALNTILVASIGLMASPFPYVLKFMVIVHYILVAVMAVGISKLVKLNLLSLTLLTVTVACIFFTNTTAWKNPLLFRGVATQISTDELQAAEFLRSTQDHVLLVSDPATQGILEALTGIDTQGGAYMNAQSRQDLLKMNIRQGTILVISARTMKWLASDTKDQMSIAFNIWRPDDLSMNDELYIQKLGFHEIYRNSSMVIFRI